MGWLIQLFSYTEKVLTVLLRYNPNPSKTNRGYMTFSLIYILDETLEETPIIDMVGWFYSIGTRHSYLSSVRVL